MDAASTRAGHVSCEVMHSVGSPLVQQKHIQKKTTFCLFTKSSLFCWNPVESQLILILMYFVSRRSFPLDVRG